MPPAKRDKALATLPATGLVVVAAVTRTGIDRFVRDGRIIQYPVPPDDRLELLTRAQDRELPAAAELSERDLGERLSALTSDMAALRWCVGCCLLLRGRRVEVL